MTSKALLSFKGSRTLPYNQTKEEDFRRKVKYFAALAAASAFGLAGLTSCSTEPEVENNLEGAAESVEGAAEDAGAAIDGAVDDAGKAIDDAATKTGDAIDGAAQDLDNAVEPCAAADPCAAEPCAAE